MPDITDFTDFDPEVIPMVRYFNGTGLPTAMSCQGHPEAPYMHFFWIEFDQDVDRDAVAAFQHRHSVPGHGFVARGMFCRRLGFGNVHGDPVPNDSFRYVAASAADAMEDLRDWLRDDGAGTPPDWRTCHPAVFSDAMNAFHRGRDPKDMSDAIAYVLYTRWRDDLASGAYPEDQAHDAARYRDELKKECLRRGIPCGG